VKESGEKAILVGTYQWRFRARRDPYTPDIEDTLAELRQLTKTVGGEVLHIITCRLDRINPRTYINKGKIEEIARLVALTKSDLVIFDDELSPRQSKNLEELFKARTIDRRAVILEVFAQRAQTHEGKLQVELAQLIYLLPRLTRMWTHLERQKGGIGLRGPGETQLELDRRVIRERMRRLRRALKTVQNSRQLQRAKRKRVPVRQAVLVGYTNSGKSTLFNQLTGSEAVAVDKLFTTLDPTTRRLQLPGHQQVLLTDSVGFIRKLPHELVEAFKSTLEEIQRADLILHVVDCADPLWESHKIATEGVLSDLDCQSKPLLEVYNKIDRLAGSQFGIAQSARRVFISALKGQNLDRLRQQIADTLLGDRKRIRLILPQGRGDLLAQVHREGNIVKEDYQAEYVELTVDLPIKRIDQWKKNGFVVVDSPSLVF